MSEFQEGLIIGFLIATFIAFGMLGIAIMSFQEPNNKNSSKEKKDN